MKTLLKLSALTVFGFMMLYTADTTAQGRWAQGDQSAEIDLEVQADLVFLREEEKLARDVYLTLYDVWRIPIFSNIASSEQQHMSRVGFLLDIYNIPDPVGANPVGVFEEPELAELYHELVELGLESEINALVVGAMIEDLDILDIHEMMDRTDNARILNVYSSLVCGSRNHMRSFYSQLEDRGVEYEPQFITNDQLKKIVFSDRERCGRR